MTADELDRYAGEVARIAVELGDPAPPRTWSELDAALNRHRANLAVTEQSRLAWAFLASAHKVLPAAARPVYELLFAGAVACLPDWARSLWGADRPSVAEVAACRAVVRGVGALLGEPPRAAQARARTAAA
jgi:hypothetical protein